MMTPVNKTTIKIALIAALVICLIAVFVLFGLSMKEIIENPYSGPVAHEAQSFPASSSECNCDDTGGNSNYEAYSPG